MRVLVCGGRDYHDATVMYAVLDSLREKFGIECVIHGAAPGADTLAGMWASTRSVPIESYPAQWGKFGRRAGPVRNARMLKDGRPDFVLAFPGGVGTADMVGKARKAGVETKVIETVRT